MTWLRRLTTAPPPYQTDPTPMRLLLLLLIGVGLVGLGAIFTAPDQNPWLVAIAGALLSLASLVAGGFFGFLFGIPRALTSERAGTGAENTNLGRGYLPNSNLEQVSDWLTKILIGVTLTQIGEIPGLVQRLVDYVRGPFLPPSTSSGFVLSTLVLYSVGGFLVGYLWSRLYLGRALRLADDTSLSERRVQLEAELAGVNGALAEADARRLTRRAE